MDAREVIDHLLQRAQWSSSRSSGPGGQRRDKVETRAELVLGVEALEGLEPALAARLSACLGIDESPLRITSQESRLLSRNQEIVAGRLAERVTAAMAPPSPPRRPTRPSRARREARLSQKTRRGGVKRLRQTPGPDD